MDQDSGSDHSGEEEAIDDRVEDDPTLIAKVRDGDAAAFEVLYLRHKAAAQYVAQAQTDNLSDADDVVAEAFASIFQSMTEGKGPVQFFRPYLLTAVRRIAYTHNRKATRLRLTGDDARLETVAFDDDPVLTAFESSTMANAFRSLPERWQSALWYVDIEGMKPAAAAPLIGLSPNGVSSLVIRAREGLREAYLQNHIALSSSDSCAEFSSQLGKFARNGLKRTSREKVEAHLKGCAKCTALLADLNDIQAGMKAAMFPLVTGIAFTSSVADNLPFGTHTESLIPIGYGSMGVPWKAVAAAVILGGIALATLTGSLAQTSTGPVAAATDAIESSEPPVPEDPPTARTEPFAEATLVPTVGGEEDPEPVAPVDAPPSSTLPRRSATVSGSGTVFSTTGPEVVENSPAPSHTVTAAFGVQPGATATERRISVDFALQGNGTPSTGDVVFALSPGARFAPGTVSAPSGWACTESSSGPGQIRCTSASIDAASLGFKLGLSVSEFPERHTLSYEFSGRGITTKTFANAFE